MSVTPRFHPISINHGVLIRVSDAVVSENSKAQLVLIAAVIDKNTFVTSLKRFVPSIESHDTWICRGPVEDRGLV